MISVLVTGAEGQLGKCIEEISKEHQNISFSFTNKYDLDITDKNAVSRFFNERDFDWCINCAAYTQVERAEKESTLAYKINVTGVRNISKFCYEYNIKLIHISTDFVFDGQKHIPYTEEDVTQPINIYGNTKLKGEKEVSKSNPNSFIIRTSWLYSEHGDNFLRTVLRLAKKMDKISIVNDQFGSPTYARDLSEAIFKIIIRNNEKYGIYNYCNTGITSWFEFAKAIYKEKNIKTQIVPISSRDYKTLAKRPPFSALNNQKIIKTFDLEILDWKTSLKEALLKIERTNT